MTTPRRCVPQGELLETRLSPVGFYEGPAPIPVRLFLQGTAQGVALIRPAKFGGGTVLNLAAVGSITPIGHTSLTGSLRQTGNFEQGWLSLNSPKHRLTLHVAGPVPQGPTTSQFEIVQGQGVAVNTTYAFEREFGSGTVVITVSPGSGRVPLSLAFKSRP